MDSLSLEGLNYQTYAFLLFLQDSICWHFDFAERTAAKLLSGPHSRDLLCLLLLSQQLRGSVSLLGHRSLSRSVTWASPSELVIPDQQIFSNLHKGSETKLLYELDQSLPYLYISAIVGCSSEDLIFLF